MRLKLSKFFKYVGLFLGIVFYFGFVYWFDVVKAFFLMVRFESLYRWKKIDDLVVRYQKSHMDDIRGENSHGNN